MAEKFLPEYDNARRNGTPRQQDPCNKRRGLMSAPETNLGVDDEPEQRDWQLHEQNERREPADGSHARILIEPAPERK